MEKFKFKTLVIPKIHQEIQKVKVLMMKKMKMMIQETIYFFKDQIIIQQHFKKKRN
jgi:hypothetical protein